MEFQPSTQSNFLNSFELGRLNQLWLRPVSSYRPHVESVSQPVAPLTIDSHSDHIREREAHCVSWLPLIGFYEKEYVMCFNLLHT